MTETIKACINCAYCEGDDFFLFCHHSDYSRRVKDYIHGSIKTVPRLCLIAREDEKLCGDAARGWEEKPHVNPEPPISFQSWVKQRLFGSSR